MLLHSDIRRTWSLVIVAALPLAGGLMMQAQAAGPTRVIALTLGGDSNMNRDALSWSSSISYARGFDTPGWYGKGWSVELEYGQENDHEVNKITESVNAYAGLYYDLSSNTGISVQLGRGLKERVRDEGGWTNAGNTLIDVGIGRDFHTFLGNNAVALTATYDLDEDELAIGASYTVFWKY
jgi:hypothetical protein